MSKNERITSSESRPYYEATGKEEEVFKLCHSSKLPMLLKGPTGCGKSRFVDAMAFDLGVPLITVACNEDTSATDLLGRFLIKGSDTVWQDGPLTRAVRMGAILYLDEVVEAREDVIVLIHSLTDYRRSLFIDAIGESIVAPPSFQMVLSYNPGYQRSFKELKASTRQRFVALTFGYPSASVETKIVITESKAPEKLCEKLVALANKIRSLSELGLSESVSTRLIVNAALLAQGGLNPRLAADVAIAQSLSDEPESNRALRDLAALYL